jgi:hypothetical protein
MMVNQKNKIARDFVDMRKSEGPSPISFESFVTGLYCLAQQNFMHLFLLFYGPLTLGNRL